VGHSGGGHSRTTTNSSQQDRQPPPQQANIVNADDRTIKRQHSVRFVGPNAVQRRQSIGTRATQAPVPLKASSSTLRPMAITTTAPVPAAYRPPSRSSSIGKASIGKATADSFATALTAYDEYYAREDDVASTPSSYRRIRRSKSMFSPLQAPDVFYTNGTPDRPDSSYIGRQNSLSASRTPQTLPSQAPLRAPKSMSFLRGGRDHMTSVLRERNDVAVQMARDRFFHQAAQQRLREQPSFLFRSRTLKQEKPFRKSVRSSSSNSYGMPVASQNQNQPPKDSGLKDKARKVSRNLKSKLKRVFGFSKEEPVSIPNQQVDARETHVRKYCGDPNLTHGSFNNIPRPDEAALSRVASRVPSLHVASSTQQLRSHTGSVKSTRSDYSDDRSRVTSWNSTGVNTVTSQGARAQLEREQQRLSIINEHGTHVSSSSFNRPRLGGQFSAYPLLHRPSKSVGHLPAPAPGPVDSARVYSALMKRLDENSPKAKLEAARKASFESFTAPKQVPPRGSSVNSSHGNRTPATIRQVPPTDSSNSSRGAGSENHDHHWARADSVHAARAEDVFGNVGTHIHRWVAADPLREVRMRNEDDVFSPKASVDNKENFPIDLQRGRSESTASASALSRQASTKNSYYTVPENFGMTPQELAHHNEPVVQGTRALRETRSTFFGSSNFTIARTASPFRRALAEGEYNPAVVNGDASTPAHSSPLRNPLFLPPKTTPIPQIEMYEDKDGQKSYTESVYSRTTSGQTPAQANSALSLALSEDVPEMPFRNSGAGDVVIIDRTTYRPMMPGSSTHRVTSSAGSTEWKKWMSSEVAKLERGKENNNSGSYINYALPTMPKSFNTGHVRESAQIDDDDTEVTQRKASAVKQPLGIIQQNPNIQNMPLPKPILKNRSTTSLVENIDTMNFNTSSIPIPPPPPPIPPRSLLRPKQSKSSLRSVATTNTVRTASAPNSAVKISSLSGRNLLHKRNGSTTTLRSVISAKSIETPVKLVKRNGRPSSYVTNTPGPRGCLDTAVEKQLGSTSTRQFGSASTRERTPYQNPGLGIAGNMGNVRAGDGPRDDIYGSEGAGLMGPSLGKRPLAGERQSMAELDAQAMGSKRMVDLFLSSRRRRIAGVSEESGGMFL
jgi:hypothetical protein